MVMEQFGEASGLGVMLTNTGAFLRYEIVNPAPTQWVAIGTVTCHIDPEKHRPDRWFVTGVGSSEEQAIRDLKVRVVMIDVPDAS